MANEKETKRDKFVRLAEKRTNKIIDTLNLLGNLSNTRAYEYSKKDVDQMFSAIETALTNAKKNYTQQASKKDTEFHFSDK